MKKTLIVVGSLLLQCSCVHRGEPQIAWYRDFTLVPISQASPVTVAEGATRQGQLGEDDWKEIVALISRLKAVRPEEKVITGISTAFDHTMTIAVKVDLANMKHVALTKNSQGKWQVIGLGMESIPHYSK